LWKLQCYELVFEYFGDLAFPPPVSIIGYVMSIVKFIRMKKYNQRKKVKTCNDENELLLEKKYAEMYLKNKQTEEEESLGLQMKASSKKIEFLEKELTEMKLKLIKS
jgi:hypothetical protein